MSERPAAFFARRYEAARARFREAAARRGAPPEETVLPGHAGPDGETLAVDCVWLGPAHAADVVVAISGTHGIEGYGGSAVQSAWLASGRALPPGMAVLMVHALNPWGMAWWSRSDADNIDVNRNFLAFPARADNPGYRALHATICPASWTAETRAAIDAALAFYEAAHGAKALTNALIAPQSDHRDGLNFTGHAPSWSRATLEAMLAKLAAGRPRRVALIDLHTGVAPPGEIAVLQFPADAEDAARARRLWSVPAPGFQLGAQGLADYSGLLVQGARAVLGPGSVCGVAEIGSVDRGAIREALRLDRWLRFHGRAAGASAPAAGTQAPAAGAEAARDRLLAVFCPQDAPWQDAALGRGCALIDHTIATLDAAWQAPGPAP